MSQIWLVPLAPFNQCIGFICLSLLLLLQHLIYPLYDWTGLADIVHCCFETYSDPLAKGGPDWRSCYLSGTSYLAHKPVCCLSGSNHITTCVTYYLNTCVTYIVCHCLFGSFPNLTVCCLSDTETTWAVCEVVIGSASVHLPFPPSQNHAARKHHPWAVGIPTFGFLWALILPGCRQQLHVQICTFFYYNTIR